MSLIQIEIFSIFCTLLFSGLCFFLSLSLSEHIFASSFHFFKRPSTFRKGRPPFLRWIRSRLADLYSSIESILHRAAFVVSFCSSRPKLRQATGARILYRAPSSFFSLSLSLSPWTRENLRFRSLTSGFTEIGFRMHRFRILTRTPADAISRRAFICAKQQVRRVIDCNPDKSLGVSRG